MKLRLFTVHAALILSQLLSSCAVPTLNEEYLASIFIKFNENKDRHGVLAAVLESSGFIEVGREGHHRLMQCMGCNLGIFVRVHDVIYENELQDAVFGESIDVPNTLEGKINIAIAMDEAGASLDCAEVHNDMTALIASDDHKAELYRCSGSR